MRSKLFKSFFIILLLIALYLAGIVMWPYISYLLLAFVLGYTLYPVYNKLLEKIKSPNWSSLIMVLTIFIVLFIPFLFIISALVQQGYESLTTYDSTTIDSLSTYVLEKTGLEINVGLYVDQGIDSLRNAFLEKSLSVISSLVDIIIGVIIMFFVLFYCFRDGDKLYASIAEAIPLKKSHREVVVDEIKLVTNAVIYGQLVTSLVQGFLGGLGFFMFGLPNPIFWGGVMAILSFLPVVGTPVVFLPAAFISLLSGNYFSALLFLTYNLIIVMNIDNVLRPFIISDKALLNPALILIGVIGGLKAFGFIGFILGPLVLGLLKVMVRVFKEDFKPSAELAQAREKKDVLIPLK